MRIVGINIPDNKRIEIALSYVYGIGRNAGFRIVEKAGVSLGKKASSLDKSELSRIQAVIEKDYVVEGELRQKIRTNISRLKEIKSNRGIRHIRSLPVRGQRTKSNSRTVRGNVRKTAGSGKRKVELK